MFLRIAGAAGLMLTLCATRSSEASCSDVLVLLRSGDHTASSVLYDAYARFTADGCDADARNDVQRSLLAASLAQCRRSLDVLKSHLITARLPVPPLREDIDLRFSDGEIVRATLRVLSEERRAPNCPPLDRIREPDMLRARRSLFAEIAVDGIVGALSQLAVEIDRRARRGLPEYSLPAAIMDAQRFADACQLSHGVRETTSRLLKRDLERLRAHSADQGACR